MLSRRIPHNLCNIYYPLWITIHIILFILYGPVAYLGFCHEAMGGYDFVLYSNNQLEGGYGPLTPG